MKTERKTPQTEVDMQQGVAGARAQLGLDSNDTELVGSRVGRLDPDIVDEVPSDDDTTEDSYNDNDEVEGDTSHNRDDNYYLGSSTARTSGA